MAVSLKRVAEATLLADLHWLNAKQPKAKQQPEKRLLLKGLIGRRKSSLWSKPMECIEFKSQKHIINTRNYLIKLPSLC